MTRFRLLTTSLCLTAFLCSSATVLAQKENPDAEPKMTLKVYRISDLFTPRPDYPYRGGLPTTGALRTQSSESTNNSGPTGGFGSGQSGGGNQGGGGGAGFFQVPDPIPRVAQFGGGGGLGGGGLGGMEGFGMQAGPGLDDSLRFTRDELIDAIVNTVMPDSWEQTAAGDAKCTSLGGLLLILQTEEGHKQIDKLLSDIRTEGGSLHTVTVDATWVSLSAEDFETLTPKKNGQEGELSAVDPATLKKIVENNPSYQGQLSCYNDQTVHLVSGNRRSVVVNAIPTVGFGAIGYSPVVACPNIGVLLQVRPTVDPNRKTAVLNLTSTFTEWQDPGDAVVIKTEFQGGQKDGLVLKGGASEMSIDRVNLKAQHLGTTVRLPVGQPVLIGGMSHVATDKKLQAQDSARQLYLIIKLTVNDGPKPPAS